VTDAEAALAPFLRDVAATTDLDLRVEYVRVEHDDPRDQPGLSAMVWAPSGSGTGVHLDSWASEAERILAAAEALQDLVIEEQWARASNWPMCPTHRSSHPLVPSMIDDVPYWNCPLDDSPVARIGELRL